ncbi:MAG: hypothetical protein ACE5EQ_02705 [Phycisphaerae bacterium]
MSMKSFYWAVLVLFTATSLSYGLAPPPARRPGASGKHIDRRNHRKQKLRRKPRPGQGPLGDPKSEIAWLSQGLSLEEAQEVAIAALLEAHHERNVEIQEKHGQSQEEIDQWKALREEMQEAQQARDQKRLRALQERAREMARARRKRTAPARQLKKEARQALHDDISAVLNDKQKETFENLWKGRFMPPERKAGSGRNPRVLRTLVFQLDDLQTDQRRQIDDLFKGFLESRRGANKELSREDMRQLEKKLFVDVMAILTPKQKEIVDKKLDSRHGRRHRRVGRSGPGRPGQPGETDPGGAKTDG